MHPLPPTFTIPVHATSVVVYGMFLCILNHFEKFSGYKVSFYFTLLYKFLSPLPQSQGYTTRIPFNLAPFRVSSSSSSDPFIERTPVFRCQFAARRPPPAPVRSRGGWGGEALLRKSRVKVASLGFSDARKRRRGAAGGRRTHYARKRSDAKRGKRDPSIFQSPGGRRLGRWIE